MSETTYDSAPFDIQFTSPGVPSWLLGKPTLTWFQIANTLRSSVGGINDEHAYSGACLKASGSEIFVCGGGHHNSSSNAVYSLRLADNAPVWVRRHAPTAVVAENVTRYSDGRPCARHTYQDIQYSDSRDRMFLIGANGGYGDGNFSTPVVEAFAPSGTSAGEWDTINGINYTQIPVVSMTNVGIGCCQDAAGNIWKMFNSHGQVWRFNTGVTPPTWTQMPSQSSPQDYDSFAAFDPVRNRIVQFAPSGGGYIDATTGVKTNANTTSGKPSCLWINETVNGLAGSFLTMGSGSTVQQVHPTTFATNTLSIATGTGAPTDISSIQQLRAGRFLYVAALKVVVVVNRSDENVYAFRTG